jgi:acyl carrier protein
MLPAYMVPAYLISVDGFPLNASGKIDRAGLPAPQTVAGAVAGGRVAPATLLETVIADMFATLLSGGQVGATDSFFDAGGSSLQAMRLITMMDDELEVDIGVTDVFLAPTPRQLAALLRDKHGFDDTSLDDTSLDDNTSLGDDTSLAQELPGQQAGTPLMTSSTR